MTDLNVTVSTTSSLQLTDDLAAAVAVAPRVTLEGMKAKIAGQYFFTGSTALQGVPYHPSLAILTICILVMENGFTIIGKSAPADAANYNEELGHQFAYEDAIRQLWPLEGYALREQLEAERRSVPQPVSERRDV